MVSYKALNTKEELFDDAHEVKIANAINAKAAWIICFIISKDM